MKLSKIFLKLSKFFLNGLSDSIVEAWVRNQVYVNSKELEKFTIKIANTQDEFEQGFKLLYDCYLAQGYQKEQPEYPLRITKFHLMPTSTMFIVKDGQQVVATLTHIIDSKMGLPVDSAVNLGEIRKANSRIAEISALAIKKNYRKNSSIIFALTRIVYHFSTQYAGCDAWVICVASYAEIYYRALFFFKKISHKTFKYDFARGNKSVSLYAELNELPILFKKFYRKAKESKNLHQFYMEDWDRIFKNFPEAIIRGATTPTLSVDMIRHFFKEKTGIWDQLSEHEKIDVLNAYADEPLLGFEEARLKTQSSEKRSSVRRLTHIPAEIIKPLGAFSEYNSSYIISVSEKGFLLKTNAALTAGETYKINIQATYNLKFSVSFKFLQLTEDKEAICIVATSDLETWILYYKKIDEFCLSFKNHSSDF